MMEFIENIGDYFSQHFFDEDFSKKVFDKSGFGKDHISEFNSRIVPLREKYYKFKSDYISIRRIEDKVKCAHEFHTELLNALGYINGTKSYDEPVVMDDHKIIPVRYRFNKNNKPYLYIMEMKPMIQIGDTDPDGLYEQSYIKDDWEKVLPSCWDNYEIKPEVIKEALSELFLMPEDERPVYLIMLAGPKIFLIQYEKWKFDSYLLFDLEELFTLSKTTANKNLLALFYALLAKKQFISETESILVGLEEDAHKASYGVTKTLKNAVIFAVESLANEAIDYRLNNAKTIADKKEIVKLLDNDNFAQELKDECLNFVYRLLFLFYAESRADLEIIPMNDSTYQKGYSLEMLRDLEMVALTTDSSRNGHFFSESLWKLFDFLHTGTELKDGFQLRPLDSPLFDNEQLTHLKGIQFSNIILQEIIKRLSLSESSKNKRSGRISYSNLGINQLGSVYESLLAYSGFFAREELIEVKNAKDKNSSNETFLVPKTRRDDFKETEILKKVEHPEIDVIIPKGHFVYRLNGRDRKNSASYYTPEVLTQSTVKYTLKGIIDRLKEKQQFTDGKLLGEPCADELLKLKILEPAMGAAAFHNEVINQLAVAYLELKENEEQSAGHKRIVPGKYKDESQKVKAFIAANNVYGVDINPTAVELGKLSLWLNCMHKNMETPFFAHRLGAGNAVVGAWLKVYGEKDYIQEYPSEGTITQRNKPISKPWWNKAPARVIWKKNGKLSRKRNQIYHFLLPDENMVPSFGIKLLKEELSDIQKNAFVNWRKTFKEPISSIEALRLEKICQVIDYLLEEHYKQQQGVIKNTSSVYQVYGQPDPQISTKAYDEKEILAESRNNRNAPYYKLKLIMDYWCSLWFWDVRELSLLPSRTEWYNEIESILQVDTSKLTIDETDLGIKEAIRNNARAGTLFDNTDRIEIVEKLASQQRYFHNEIEFIEVFKERGGFDVIVGNPPWIKFIFEEKGIMSEEYPELEIRKTSAPQVKKFRKIYFQSKKNFNSYIDENISTESTSKFLNAIQNYQLLKGQQTDIYKCVLVNSVYATNSLGFCGLVHPESIYDDSKGGILREFIYKRLKYHFHFKNILKLFQEVHHRLDYSSNIYSGKQDEISFKSISNLLHPNQIESFQNNNSFIDNSLTIKNNDDNWTWNLSGNSNRIIEYNSLTLHVLWELFETTGNSKSAKLVNIQSKELFDVLHKLSSQTIRIKNFNCAFSEGYHETNSVADDTIVSMISTNVLNGDEIILSGPMISVSYPIFKMPISSCSDSSHYDFIDLNNFNYPNEIRTIYQPKKLDKSAKNELYRIGFRKMVDVDGERTLQPSLLAPSMSHVNSIISLKHEDPSLILKILGLTSSVVFDFFIKTIGSPNLQGSRINPLPVNVPTIYVDKLTLRVLKLNCVNILYKPIWEKSFKDVFMNDSWSIDKKGLELINVYGKSWNQNSCFKNMLSRRQALVEIDVIVAMIFNLTLSELIQLYNIVFSISKKFEDDTWYDIKGNIVFTPSGKTLKAIGVERVTWNTIKDFKEGETYEHIIEKSELYYGKKVTYYAPFDKCDRVEDYKTAWAHFKKVFNKKEVV